MTKMLRVEDIDVYYQVIPVLRGVSLEVGEEEFVSLLGPNGAGKTTTVKTLMGVLRPQSGRIFFDGQGRTRVSAKAYLKYVAGEKPAEKTGHRKKGQLLMENLADSR